MPHRTWSDAYRGERSGYAIGIYVGPHGDVVPGSAVKSEMLKSFNQTQYNESVPTVLKGRYNLVAVGHSHPHGVYRGPGDWEVATRGVAVFKARGDGHPQTRTEPKVYSSIDVLIMPDRRKPGLMFNISSEGRVSGGESAREPRWPDEHGGY